MYIYINCTRCKSTIISLYSIIMLLCMNTFFWGGGWQGREHVGKWMAVEVEDLGNTYNPQTTRNSKIQSAYFLITMISVSFAHI